MPALKDLTGKTFGRLKVVQRGAGYKYYDRKRLRHIEFCRWLCRCDCGRKVLIRADGLNSGHHVSCGCKRHEAEDLIGQSFGKLTSLKRVKQPCHEKRRGAWWLCKCTCGNLRIALAGDLKSGNARTCRSIKHRTGEEAHNWKGGRLAIGGYISVYAPGHPSAHSHGKGYVLEHRLVMEKMIGRFLRPEETVHHKNGVRHDNCPSNLELWNTAHSKGARVVDLLSYSFYLLHTYLPTHEKTILKGIRALAPVTKAHKADGLLGRLNRTAP